MGSRPDSESPKVSSIVRSKVVPMERVIWMRVIRSASRVWGGKKNVRISMALSQAGVKLVELLKQSVVQLGQLGECSHGRQDVYRIHIA
jgi:hypothetical protein